VERKQNKLTKKGVLLDQTFPGGGGGILETLHFPKKGNYKWTVAVTIVSGVIVCQSLLWHNWELPNFHTDTGLRLAFL